MKLIIIIFSILAIARANELSTANKYYLEGDFDKAIDSYQGLIKNSPNGEYYYNLGAAYFRKNAIAEAIFNFRLASEILPRDEDIKYNLEYARSLKKQQFEENVSFLEKIQFPLSEGESILLLLLLSCVITWLGFHLKTKKTGILVNFNKITILLFILLLINHINLDISRKPFVVIKKEGTKVYSGPGQNNVVLFEVGSGNEGDLVNQFEKKWIQVKFSKDKKGWILSENLVI